VRVAVVALGKIGLPLAVQIASKGIEVIGADVSRQVVDLVNAGSAPFPGEAHLEERLARVHGEGMLSATTDTTAAVSESDVVIVVVPLMTDVGGVPDFSAMDAATGAVAAGLRRGTLVSYETTLPVGTTRNRFAPMLEAASGLVAGEDFYLVHSPERVFSGRIFSDLGRYPKLVGGVDQRSTGEGVEFYEKILDFDDRPDLTRGNGVWAMASAESAEMAKLAETTYRDVNIALANEFAAFAEQAGIDIDEVITASNSQPFSHIHRPGVAVGGHCIPVYPRFYLSGHPGAELVETARRVNLGVPERVVETVSSHIGGLSGRRVLILGAAYRGGVKETAYSGVFDLKHAIEERGGRVVVSDPLFTGEELRNLGLEPWSGDEIDAVIVQADHAEYSELGPDDMPGAQLVFDGRGVIDTRRWQDSKVPVVVIGQGSTID
jgi:nucleotide sugar dehydrogenase